MSGGQLSSNSYPSDEDSPLDIDTPIISVDFLTVRRRVNTSVFPVSPIVPHVDTTPIPWQPLRRRSNSCPNLPSLSDNEYDDSDSEEKERDISGRNSPVMNLLRRQYSSGNSFLLKKFAWAVVCFTFILTLTMRDTFSSHEIHNNGIMGEVRGHYRVDVGEGYVPDYSSHVAKDGGSSSKLSLSKKEAAELNAAQIVSEKLDRKKGNEESRTHHAKNGRIVRRPNLALAKRKPHVVDRRPKLREHRVESTFDEIKDDNETEGGVNQASIFVGIVAAAVFAMFVFLKGTRRIIYFVRQR